MDWEKKARLSNFTRRRRRRRRPGCVNKTNEPKPTTTHVVTRSLSVCTYSSHEEEFGNSQTNGMDPPTLCFS
jgi:hypothetical protein